MKQVNTGGLPFNRMRDNDKYYVDKSLLIADILDTGDHGVYLFTRPRRFGKTTNITMLDAFFNIRYQGNTWFDDLEISKTDRYARYKNAFPVIHIDLKDLSCASMADFTGDLIVAVNNAINPFSEVLDGIALSDYERGLLSDVFSRKVSASDLKASIAIMCGILKRHYGKGVIVLIDEYDRAVTDSFGTEIQSDIMAMLGGFLSSTLKSNPALQMAYVTGVMKVAKSGMFSSLNNMKVNDIFSASSDERFGFTESEVRAITEYYSHPESFDEAKEWYDGYRFGNAEVYNPFSVMNYVQNGFVADSYWVNTSVDVPLKWLISRVDLSNLSEMANLMNGFGIRKRLHFDLTYDDFRVSGTDELYALMIMTGYLNAVPVGDGAFDISIPNKEVMGVVDGLLRGNTKLSSELFTRFNAALLDGDADTMAETLQSILVDGSYYLLKDEQSYELVLLTLMHGILKGYRVCSERESGNGRVDLMLEPVSEGTVLIILELKAAVKETDLDSEVEAGLRQIHDRKYHLGMKGRIILVSLAFCGKMVRSRCEVVEGRFRGSLLG